MGTKFTVEEISAILEMMRSNEVTEFRLELGDGKLWLKRGADIPTVISIPQPSALPAMSPPQSQVQAQITGVQAPILPSVPVPQNSLTAERKLHEVKSPMVGTFYKRPSPDAPPYVQVGDVVRKGQVLCIVEAMKLMNEIQSDVAGKVVEVCLDDGQMSEYGEVLFRIDVGV